VLRVPIGEVSLEDLASVLDRLGAASMATLMDGDPYDSVDIDVARPLALLLGNEAHGLPAEVLSATDHVVSIPMGGAVESLNVATAGAVLAFDHARRVRAQTS
jgi:TrmH family RNA methyltransferase